MFGLTNSDLRRRILGCGDGPASFNSEFAKRGGHVVSIDPIYSLNAGQIQKRISEIYETVIRQMYKNTNDYVWTAIRSVEELGRVRMTAMQDFLSDYGAGKAEGRYLAGALPFLPFKGLQFDLVLCSHFLFLYSGHFPLEFHCSAVTEMCRVAHEIRIFPLLDLSGLPTPYVEPVAEAMKRSEYRVSIEPVPYEFQRGGNRMMRITASVRKSRHG